MKTFLKRSLSILLCLFMTVSVCSVAFASAKSDPIVVVSGMGAFPLYYNKDGKQTQVWAPSGEIIKDTILSSVKNMVSKGNITDGLLLSLYEDMFSYIACNEDGTSMNDISIPIFDKSVDNYPEYFENSDNDEDEIGVIKTLCRNYGAENVYFFNYDWRLDPFADADGLNAFINNVLETTGSSKVTLIPCSMGGIVTNSYLYKYGSSKVSKIIYALVAAYSVDMVGELFNKNISISTDMLLERLFSFEMGKVLVQILVTAVQGGVNNTLLSAGIDSLVKKLLDSVNYKAYNDLLSKTFANFPGIWAMVGDEYYLEAKKLMFPNGMNAKLESVADDYHYNVRNQADNLMKKVESSGTDIYVLASYGYVGIPVTDKAWEQTDCLIETKNESFGATVADYGKTLVAGYKIAGTSCSDESHNHLSTDGVVDASTCLFPETTWFIKNNRHVGLNTNTDCAKLLTYLVDTDGATVSSNESFPQFIELNPVTGKFSSLSGSEIKQPTHFENAFARLIYIIRAIIDTVKKYLGF